MHVEILDEKRIALLKIIAEQIDIGTYYMAGGTALSLQLGLRKSVDFDFFVPNHFNAERLYEQLTDTGYCIERINVYDGTCDVLMDGIQVSFFFYPQKMLRSYIEVNEFGGLLMASPEDIAVMKAAAIGSRGAKKDFFDLYQIFHMTDFTVADLVDGLYQKFGDKYNFSYIGMGLNYFEDAEHEVLPMTYVNTEWKTIKKFFSEIQEPFFH